jgi:hypothetical protein
VQQAAAAAAADECPVTQKGLRIIMMMKDKAK